HRINGSSSPNPSSPFAAMAAMHSHPSTTIYSPIKPNQQHCLAVPTTRQSSLHRISNIRPSKIENPSSLLLSFLGSSKPTIIFAADGKTHLAVDIDHVDSKCMTKAQE
ncbi:hypothetical protein ACLOJK_007872, partial [Asimina triloba]